MYNLILTQSCVRILTALGKEPNSIILAYYRVCMNGAIFKYMHCIFETLCMQCMYSLAQPCVKCASSHRSLQQCIHTPCVPWGNIHLYRQLEFDFHIQSCAQF